MDSRDGAGCLPRSSARDSWAHRPHGAQGPPGSVFKSAAISKCLASGKMGSFWTFRLLTHPSGVGGGRVTSVSWERGEQSER